jgi:hypothetical protein
MSKKRASSSVKTVAKPVTVKFKMKTGETVSIKAICTFRAKAEADFRQIPGLTVFHPKDF